MKSLLLGPNGQLGGDICDVWDEHGEDIIKTGRDLIDVTDIEQLQIRLNEQTFDVLINCTSYHKTDEVEDNAAQALAVNSNAVAAMASVCKQKSAKFIHISTDYVFGGDFRRTEPLTEECAPAPVNVYGLSKFHGENLARMTWHDTSVFRVASLFGVRGASGKGGNFVETMVRIARDKGELKVVGDQTMSPTSTRSIAKILWKFLEKDGAPGVYHCVNGGKASWYEFAARIIQRARINATVAPCASSEYPTRAKRPAYSALNNSKLEQITGPIPHWQDVLDEYLVRKGYR